MAASAGAELQDQCATLRLELKAWEKDFAADNAGRKAGREDIKANADIAAKYKEYNRLRDVLSGKTTKTTAVRTPKKKQRRNTTTDAGGAQFQTPSKRRAIAASEHASPQNCEDDKDGAVSAFQISTPSALRSFIGPTPQRNGVVIGLFDHLSPVAARTPSRTAAGGRSALAPIEGNIVQTPRKGGGAGEKSDEEEDVLASGGRGSRTPMSSGKRFMLDQFATPMKRKRLDASAATPTQREGKESTAAFPTPSTERRCHSTPTFLRRETHSFDATAVDGGASQRAPWKRKGLVRSLSSMIRDMKKQEDDRRDEELEAMRELEMAPGGPPSKKAAPSAGNEVTVVQDSQAVEMKLGPDALESEDSEDGAEAEESGVPRKVWKKKGLKRQTKRVIMRPVRTLSKPQTTVQVDASDEEEDPSEEVPTSTTEVVPSTAAVGSGDEFDDSGEDLDYDGDALGTPQKKRRVQKETASSRPSKPDVKPPKKGEKKEEKKQKQTRTINANAQSHANYRRLKIKSKNSRQGGGRFGRSRR